MNTFWLEWLYLKPISQYCFKDKLAYFTILVLHSPIVNGIYGLPFLQIGFKIISWHPRSLVAPYIYLFLAFNTTRTFKFTLWHISKCYTHLVSPHDENALLVLIPQRWSQNIYLSKDKSHLMCKWLSNPPDLRLNSLLLMDPIYTRN